MNQAEGVGRVWNKRQRPADGRKTDGGIGEKEERRGVNKGNSGTSTSRLKFNAKLPVGSIPTQAQIFWRDPSLLILPSPVFTLLPGWLQAKEPQNGEFTVNYLRRVLGPESMWNKEVTQDAKRLCGVMLRAANSVRTGVHLQAVTILSLLFLFFAGYISLC